MERYTVLVETGDRRSKRPEGRSVGVYSTYEQAVAKAKSVIEESLARHRYLLAEFRDRGNRAYIVPKPKQGKEFSPWAYAQELAQSREAHTTE